MTKLYIQHSQLLTSTKRMSYANNVSNDIILKIDPLCKYIVEKPLLILLFQNIGSKAQNSLRVLNLRGLCQICSIAKNTNDSMKYDIGQNAVKLTIAFWYLKKLLFVIHIIRRQQNSHSQLFPLLKLAPEIEQNINGRPKT